MNNSIKTVYVCIHDGQKFGETPILKMEIHKQTYINHKQLINFKHRLERFIDDELKELNHKPDNSGAYM